MVQGTGFRVQGKRGEYFKIINRKSRIINQKLRIADSKTFNIVHPTSKSNYVCKIGWKGGKVQGSGFRVNG